MSQTTKQHSPVRAMAVGGFSQIVCSLPVFLVGAMAVQITGDLGFGTVGLGLAVATFHGTGALASVYMGRLVDRLGAIASLRLAVLAAVATSLGIALTAVNVLSLAAWLTLGGVCRSIALPAANRLLVNRVRPERLGTAFGLKQSAAPVASMLAGLAVPLVAVTLGWRVAFALTATAAFVMVFAIGRRPTMQQRRAGRSGPASSLHNRSALLVLTLGFGLAFIVHSAILGFYVDAAAWAGSSPEVAGTVLAGASVAAIMVRLIAGVTCDRTRVDPLVLSAALVAIGGVGLALLASAVPILMGIGAFIGLAGAWGFPGLFWYALMLVYSDAPGRVTGALAPGSVGGVIGPLLFGLIADRAGYPAAWSSAAVVALVAASTMAIAARRLQVRGAAA